MKISQLTESAGTFIGVRLTTGSVRNLVGWMLKNKIENQTSPDRLHVTLILDTTRQFQHHPVRYDPPIRIDPKTYSIDLFNDGDVLVLCFDCPTLEDRHHKMRTKYGIEWKHPDYSPHITLTTKIQQIKSDLEVPDFPIFLDREYVEAFGW